MNKENADYIFDSSYTTFFGKIIYMFSNLTLYYLNQIGIRPWINKEYSSNIKYQSKREYLQKLVVLISSDLNKKSRILLNHMMDYINIKNHELLIIKIREDEINREDKQQWLSQLSRDNPPLALLSLGPKINDINLPYRIFQSLPLDYLLDNPVSKKEVFHALTRIKRLIE